MAHHNLWYRFYLIFILCFAASLASAQSLAENLDQERPRIAPVLVSSRSAAKAFSGHRVQINLHMPKNAGPLTIEVLNQTSFPIGLLEFDLQVLGASGNIRFSSITKGGKGRNVIQIPSNRELAVRNILVFNEDAVEQFPRVIVQVIWPEGSQPAS
ncbi:MAG: hypothetical protein ACOH5I_07595 [Oligoflexus sp.]